MKSYILEGSNNKALVFIDDNGNEILISYGTPILKRTASGELIRLWDSWSNTTGRHIKNFLRLK